MFKKIVELLKEVFFIKRPATKTPRKTLKKTPKKRIPAKKQVPVPKPKTPKIAPKPAPKGPRPAKSVKAGLDPALKPIGEITHYFDRIKVAVLKINQGTVLIGDRLTIVSGKIKFVQKVWSMQIESEDVKVAKKGQLIGIKVDKQVNPGDKVYK